MFGTHKAEPLTADHSENRAKEGWSAKRESGRKRFWKKEVLIGEWSVIRGSTVPHIEINMGTHTHTHTPPHTQTEPLTSRTSSSLMSLVISFLALLMANSLVASMARYKRRSPSFGSLPGCTYVPRTVIPASEYSQIWANASCWKHNGQLLRGSYDHSLPRNERNMSQSYVYGPGHKCVSITTFSDCRFCWYEAFAGMKQHGRSIYAHYY